MNYLERSFLSVIKRPFKSLVLLLIVFLLGNIIIGSFMVSNSTKLLEMSFKEKTGALATIHSNIQDPSDENSIFHYQSFNDTYQELSQILEEIRTLDGVKDLDYRTYSNIDLHLLTPSGSDKCNNYIYDKGCYQVGYSGVSSSNFNELEIERITLKQGRSFTKDEIKGGAQVGLIPEHSLIKNTEGNPVKVGDKVDFSSYAFESDASYYVSELISVQKVMSKKDYEVEIVGMYEVNKLIDNKGLDEKAFDYNNHIFLPSLFLVSVSQDIDALYSSSWTEEGGHFRYSPLGIDNVRIHLNDPERINEMSSDIQSIISKKGSSKAGYELVTSDHDFKKIMGPISALKTLGSTILYLSMGLSIALLSLVIVFFLRERKYELGVYMALGEKKVKIASQILLEVLLITLLGVSLSLFSAKFFASGLSDTLTSAISVNLDKDKGTFIDVSSNDLIKEFRIETSGDDIGLIYALSVVTVVISTLIPSIYIFKMKPKKVLIN